MVSRRAEIFSDARDRIRHDLGSAPTGSVPVLRTGTGFCAATQSVPASVIRTLSFESESPAVCVPTSYISRDFQACSWLRHPPTSSVGGYSSLIVLSGQAILRLYGSVAPGRVPLAGQMNNVARSLKKRWAGGFRRSLSWVPPAAMRYRSTLLLSRHSEVKLDSEL